MSGRLIDGDELRVDVSDLLDKSQRKIKAAMARAGLDKAATERHVQSLLHRLRRPVPDGTIAVFARKGGVGKTTIATYLGLTFAEERGGRILAIDGDQETCSLGWTLAPSAVPQLNRLANGPAPRGFRDLCQHVVQAPEGIDVLSCEPFESGLLNQRGLRDVMSVVGETYDVAISDIGPIGGMPNASALLDSSRVAVLVVGSSIDGVRAAERALAWFERRDVRRRQPVVAVLNGVSDDMDPDELERIEDIFAESCVEVVQIPWDAHLSSGSPIASLERLAKPTQIAFMELAAAVIDACRPRRGSRNHREGGNFAYRS